MRVIGSFASGDLFLEDEQGGQWPVRAGASLGVEDYCRLDELGQNMRNAVTTGGDVPAAWYDMLGFIVPSMPAAPLAALDFDEVQKVVTLWMRHIQRYQAQAKEKHAKRVEQHGPRGTSLAHLLSTPRRARGRRRR